MMKKIKLGDNYKAYFKVSKTINGMKIIDGGWYNGIIVVMYPLERYTLVGIKCNDEQVPNCKETVFYRLMNDECDFDGRNYSDEIARNIENIDYNKKENKK